MTPERLTLILLSTVDTVALPPAVRHDLICCALQQFFRRSPLCGVFVSATTVTMPRCLLVSRN